jgi:hypothetical protein
MGNPSENEVKMATLKGEEYIEEVTLARLTEEDLWKLSEDSLSVWSWTGFRLGLIMFVHGCNQVSIKLALPCWKLTQN